MNFQYVLIPLAAIAIWLFFSFFGEKLQKHIKAISIISVGIIVLSIIWQVLMLYRFNRLTLETFPDLLLPGGLIALFFYIGFRQKGDQEKEQID